MQAHGQTTICRGLLGCMGIGQGQFSAIPIVERSEAQLRLLHVLNMRFLWHELIRAALHFTASVDGSLSHLLFHLPNARARRYQQALLPLSSQHDPTYPSPGCSHATARAGD